MKEKSGFKLGPKHPYSLAVSGKHSGGSSGDGPTNRGQENKEEMPRRNKLGENNNQSTNAFSKLSSKCEELEKSSENPQMAQWRVS